MAIEVREGDVTRAAVRLDSVAAAGTAALTLRVRGATGTHVTVHAADRLSGRKIFEKRAEIRDGAVRLREVPLGLWHLDDSGAAGCYDVDAGDGDLLFDLPLLVEIDPFRRFLPDPPDPGPLFGLSEKYAGLARVLPELGVRTVQELANVEGEDLMHRFRTSGLARHMSIPNPLFGGVVQEARALTGLATSAGPQAARFLLGHGKTYRRAFLPAAAGKAEFTFDIPAGHAAEVVIAKPSGSKRQKIEGRRTLSLEITAEDIASEKPIEVSILNTAGKDYPVRWNSLLPATEIRPSFVFSPPSTRDGIAAIYAAWASRNPGISPDVVETSLAPENIRGWIDRARTFFSMTGVCSINDLGTFRMNPMQRLVPGAYVAPFKKPSGPGDVVSLGHYAFSKVINGSILYYRPNDTLHDTALVMAGAWDIRGQVVVIGQEVRELVVIAKSVLHDGGSRIAWERPALPSAYTYFPDKAARGADGASPGQSGQPGANGDFDPHPAHNGGGNADVPGPIVTLYILDATNNLPPSTSQGRTEGRAASASTVATAATAPRASTRTRISSAAAAARSDGAATAATAATPATAVKAGVAARAAG